MAASIVSNPAPSLVTEVLVLLTMVEEMVSPPKVLFWTMARFWLAAPVSVPPVMVERLLPTALPTRMLPALSVLRPAARVRVLAAAELKRKLLVVMAASRGPALLSTSILPFK